MRYSAVLALLFSAVCWLSGAQQNQRDGAADDQKPIREELLDVTYRRPPDTVAQMVDAATAVILAEWTGQSRLVERGVSGGGIPLPRTTAYAFRILEIMKLDPLLPFVGDEVEFKVIGGTEEFPSHIERTKNRAALDFEQHHRYLMFVARDLTTSELYLMWGPLGVYDVTQQTVESLSPNWRRHNDSDTNAFVAATRSAATR